MTLKLPRLVSDGMVLQRGKDTALWGWADANATVTVELDGHIVHTTAEADGRWRLLLPPLQAGGPHDLTVSSLDEVVTVRDVLIGDVWYCGGQSNMELPMSRVEPRYPDELKSARQNNIRQFLVERTQCFDGPRDDYNCVDTSATPELAHRNLWESVSPETIGDFFATSYFFAKVLYARHRVPIGLINCAVGGTMVEAWSSAQTVSRYEDASAEAERCRQDGYVADTMRRDAEAIQQWIDELDAADVGLRECWEKTEHPDWERVEPTCDWSAHPSLCRNGAFWFEGDVDIADTGAALLILGALRDSDTAYINGIEVGATGYQYPPRRYPIPDGLLRNGRNRVTVRVVSNRGIGGFVEGKRYGIETSGGFAAIQNWRFKLGATMATPMHEATRFENMPTGLYNAMLSPALNATIKGAIWYQGESNTGAPLVYRERFEAMLEGMRKRWGCVPFIFTQLANYVSPHTPSDTGGWPELREQQRRCLELSRTAMAVTIDIGEYNDLHPLNKSEVGRRLALAALGTAYGEGIEFSGPALNRVYREHGVINVTFTHADGLRAIAPSAESHGGKALGTLMLSAAGADRNFYDIAAEIDGERLIIRDNDAMFIRYMWVDNPRSALLYNSAGLPASPFEAAVE